MIPDTKKGFIKVYNTNQFNLFFTKYFEKSFFQKNFSPLGLKKFQFESNNFDFQEICRNAISKILNKKYNYKLEELHLNTPAELKEILWYGETTKFNDIIFNHIDLFKKTYISFLKKVIRPIIKEDFYYQTIPTLRIFFPNPKWKTLKPFYHSDIFLGHAIECINFWVPLTKSFSTNSMSYLDLDNSIKLLKEEKLDLIKFYENYYENDSSTFKKISKYLNFYEGTYGSFLGFDSRCLHGTNENLTDSTRISIDFRIIPLSEYNKINIEYIGTGRKKMPMKKGFFYCSNSIDQS